MSAIAERLHAVAHRAAMAGRDLDDSWPSPLETALAATALLKHGQAYREDAERAINRALRWWQDEKSSETSGDAAALALLARACHETQRTNTSLTAAAVAAVEKLTEQQMQSLPVLHLFLAAWGLSELVPDRHSPLWSRLNDQVARASKLGVEQPLATLTLALGSTTMSASSLAQQLISEVSASPSVIDGTVLCSALTVGIAITSAVLPPTDSALQLLVTRRMQVLERLNDEIDERTFIQPEIADFDPDVEPTAVRTFLTSFEALLLDFGLASRDESKPWLLFEDAQKLFGMREESAISVGNQRVSRTRAWLAISTTLLAIAAGGFLRFGLTTLKVRPGIANAGAISLCAAILVVAVVVSPGRDSRTRESSGLFFVMTSLLSAVVAVNQSMKKPFLGDVAGLVLGTGLAALAAVVWFTIKRQDS